MAVEFAKLAPDEKVLDRITGRAGYIYNEATLTNKRLILYKRVHSLLFLLLGTTQSIPLGDIERTEYKTFLATHILRFHLNKAPSAGRRYATSLFGQRLKILQGTPKYAAFQAGAIIDGLTGNQRVQNFGELVEKEAMRARLGTQSARNPQSQTHEQNKSKTDLSALEREDRFEA